MKDRALVSNTKFSNLMSPFGQTINVCMTAQYVEVVSEIIRGINNS